MGFSLENRFIGTWQGIDGQAGMEFTFFRDNTCLITEAGGGKVDIRAPYSFTETRLVIDVYDFLLKYLTDGMKNDDDPYEIMAALIEPMARGMADSGFTFEYVMAGNTLTLTNAMPENNVTRLTRKGGTVK
jgi:hypothetical protein